MSRVPRSESTGSRPSFLERRLSRLTTSSRSASSTSEDTRGPLGLNLLHQPSETHVDLVFVHGLRGGSRKTWSASGDVSTFWPQVWLPSELGFKNVRIHSYGYNSDWAERKSNALNILDFGKGLVGDLNSSPEIRRSETTPLILVGHSMGGLVIKQSTNDEFRHVYGDVQVCSFYETVKTNLGYSQDLVVPKDSAVMGLPGERTQPLSADHRHVCKYESPKDPNYASVRNALLATVEAIEKEWSFTQRDERRAQLKSIAHYLSAPMRPEDELAKLDDIKINNSCLWLTNKAKFLDWQSDRYQDALDSGPNIFWLSGKPGCGKSVLTAHVIKYLESCNGDCSYYFFKHNNKEASSASALIRSLACQMAETNPLIRQELLAMVSEAEFLNKNDENSVWKTIFLKRILRLDFHQPHYWIIDALDESPNYESVLQLVTRIQRTLPLKIFITSRPLTLFDRLSNQDRLSFVADFGKIPVSISSKR
ncbi:hypothetical protein PG991_014439 [Apiospora marii]|uniref:Nephrocystin 3-like N-terminal domain-containing protein n=1 Tax=Apiospora marii TaxID=335849 RepID=A0ABR1R5C9_9PEZI